MAVESETEQETNQDALEAVLKEGQPSLDEEEVSGKEESKEPKEEKKGEIAFTPEQETEIAKRAQSWKDKELNPYREKRESDTALIRSLQTQLKELKTEKGVKGLSKAMEAVLAGDEEEGVEPDKIEGRRKAWGEVKKTITDYKEKAAEVEEAAQVVSNMTEKLPPKVVREFALDDPNPSIRAVNGAKFLDETAAVYQYTENFLMAVEEFLPKGDELRKQIEEVVEGLSEFNDEKSKKLYLRDKVQGVKVTTRKKPQIPSDTLGGINLEELSPREKIDRGIEIAKQKKK